MSWKDWFDQVCSLVLFNHACQKSMTGFSHTPLETAFSLHRGNTTWPPRLFQLPVIISSNFTRSKVILSGDFYRGNAVDPPARVKPPWDTKIYSFPLESNPHQLGGWGGGILKNHMSCTVYLGLLLDCNCYIWVCNLSVIILKLIRNVQHSLYFSP